MHPSLLAELGLDPPRLTHKFSALAQTKKFGQMMFRDMCLPEPEFQPL
jgi:hypothetical protein